MSRSIELRRHTDHEHDVLTPDGVQLALEAAARLGPHYDAFVSSGAQRATQTLACFLAVMPPQDAGVTINREFWSPYAELWADLGQRTKGGVEALREADQKLFASEAARFADALRATFAALPPDGRALVVGHTPFIEIAVFGLTGHAVQPVAKGAGVVITERNGAYEIEEVA